MFKQKMNALKEKCKEHKKEIAIGSLKIGGIGAVGGYIGSGIGFAALGTAVAGTIPLAVVCGLGTSGALVYSHIKNSRIKTLETELEEHKKNSDGDNVIK